MKIVWNLKSFVQQNRAEVARALIEGDSEKLNATDGEFLFHDLDGNSYYRIAKTFGIFVERYGKGMEFLMWMAAGVHPDEMDELIDVANTELNRGFKGEKVDVVTLGAVFKEIQLRQHMVIHTELIYNYLAVHYIRHDENPAVFNQRIHDEKVAAFKKIVEQGGAHDFFHVPELKALNEGMNLSTNEWNEQWNASIRDQKEMKQRVRLMKSGRKSGNANGGSAKR